jgi:hypothetical protein
VGEFESVAYGLGKSFVSGVMEDDGVRRFEGITGYTAESLHRRRIQREEKKHRKGESQDGPASPRQKYGILANLVLERNTRGYLRRRRLRMTIAATPAANRLIVVGFGIAVGGTGTPTEERRLSTAHTQLGHSGRLDPLRDQRPDWDWKIRF